MRNSIYRITLDIYNETPQVQVVAKQYDAARRIYATLTEHGKPWTVPFGSRAVMVIVKPDGTQVVNDCDFRSDGTVIFDFTDFVTDVTGLLNCELQIYVAEEEPPVATPQFMILVTDTASDQGQVFGGASRAALEAVKAELKNFAKTYDTATDMAAAKDIKAGQVLQTYGRWQANDGGARTYEVTDLAGARLSDGTLNPLAIPLHGGLYALPILTDHVTAYDIGLKQGRVSGSDRPSGETTDEYALADGRIPATNSALLQNYMDHIPAIPTDPLLVDATTYAGLPTQEERAAYYADPDHKTEDQWGKKGKYNRIFFPTGNWFFRDPIVIRHPVKIFGTAMTKGHYNNRDTVGIDYPISRLVYFPRELTIAAGSGASITPFVSETTGYQVVEQPSANRGDQSVDTDNNVKESLYIDTALFFAAEFGISFEDLEISAANSFSWYRDAYAGYRPGEGTASDTGNAYNPFGCIRKLKGINGVICGAPKTDDRGRIKVSTSGMILFDYENNSASFKQSKTKFTTFERCQFSGFSGAAIVMGSLTNVDDCQFNLNFIAISSSGHDSWVHRIYAQTGFIGILTNSHTCYVYDSYIDLMQGFGVCTSYNLKKKSQTTHRDNTCWDYVSLELVGALVGNYDVTMDYCILGAYGAGRVTDLVRIDGRIGHCGCLYTVTDSTVVAMDDFGSMLNFRKAADASTYTTSSNDSKYWDDTAGTWTADSDTSSSGTLASYKKSLAGKTGIALYKKYQNANIILQPTTKEFLDNEFAAGTTDEQQVAARINSFEYTETTEASLLAWLQDTTHLVEALDPNAIYETFEDYSAANKLAAINALLGINNSSTAWKNRRKNFTALIGAAAISIREINGLNLTASLQPRINSGNGVKHITPIYAISCITIYNSTVVGVAMNTMHVDLTSEEQSKAVMQPLVCQGSNYAGFYGSTIPFFSKKIQFASLYDDTKQKNSERYKFLDIKFYQNNDGSYEVRASGDICVTAGSDVISETGADMIDYEYDESTQTYVNVGNINPYIDFFPYMGYFTSGSRMGVRAVPLIGMSNFGSDDDAVAAWDIVATLVVNFFQGRVTLHPLKTYTGTILPVRL